MPVKFGDVSPRFISIDRIEFARSLPVNDQERLDDKVLVTLKSARTAFRQVLMRRSAY